MNTFVRNLFTAWDGENFRWNEPPKQHDPLPGWEVIPLYVPLDVPLSNKIECIVAPHIDDSFESWLAAKLNIHWALLFSHIKDSYYAKEWQE